MGSNVAQTSRAARSLLRSGASPLRSLHTSLPRRRPAEESVASSSQAGAGFDASLARTGSSKVSKPSSSVDQVDNGMSSLIGTSRRELPSYKIEIGPLQQNRLEEHYYNTLARDLLYMTYDHKPATHNAALAGGAQPSAGADLAASNATATVGESEERTWDLSSPYSKNRPARPLRGGGRQAMPNAENHSDLVALDQIVISSFCREALSNKAALIPLLAMMRAITGLPIEGSLADPRMRQKRELSKHGVVRIIRAKTSIATFKIRKGIPVGVQAVLPAKPALEFLEVFTTFVLPRLRTFNGFLLPPGNISAMNQAATSGVVSLGMGPEALSQFPQTEINWDAYPNLPGVGFQVDCITNQRGRGATERARQLLSGLGVPFVRRGL